MARRRSRLCWVTTPNWRHGIWWRTSTRFYGQCIYRRQWVDRRGRQRTFDWCFDRRIYGGRHSERLIACVVDDGSGRCRRSFVGVVCARILGDSNGLVYWWACTVSRCGFSARDGGLGPSGGVICWCGPCHGGGSIRRSQRCSSGRPSVVGGRRAECCNFSGERSGEPDRVGGCGCGSGASTSATSSASSHHGVAGLAGKCTCSAAACGGGCAAAGPGCARPRGVRPCRSDTCVAGPRRLGGSRTGCRAEHGRAGVTVSTGSPRQQHAGRGRTGWRCASHPHRRCI